MNRERMFPTKSRLQVAISLKMLLIAASRAALLSHGYASNGGQSHADLSMMIAHLCYTRLIDLITSCLWPGQASHYDHRNRLRQSENRAFLRTIRFWRLHYPNLLSLSSKEN